MRFTQLLALLALVCSSAACKIGDGVSPADPIRSVDPNSGAGAGAPGDGSRGDGDAGATDDANATADANANPDANATVASTCPSGTGKDPSGACVTCTKSCGASGHCVVGWEGGQHCQCAVGEYETMQGCAPAAGSPCAGITCNGHGTCFAGPPFFSAECHCEGDYVQYGVACAALHKIRCVDADGALKDKGTIRCNGAGTAFEVCRDGNGDGTVEWVASGAPACEAGVSCTQCLNAKCNSGDGTGGNPCPTGTVCMGKVHEMDVYKCMPSCDCTNCGTCDPSQFGSSWQRACGATTNGFANPTKACASPCPRASDGCLPYGQFAFCFPNEGCASGAPQ